MEFTLPLPKIQDQNAFIQTNWNSFYLRYKNFVHCVSSKIIVEDYMLSLFLHAGGEHIDSICSLIHEFHIDIAILNRVLLIMEAVCLPNILLMFERYKLLTCRQESTENINSFMEKLVHTAKNCALDDSKESLIVSCLIDGISSKNLRHILQNTPHLDLYKAKEICRKHRVSNTCRSESEMATDFWCSSKTRNMGSQDGNLIVGVNDNVWQSSIKRLNIESDRHTVVGTNDKDHNIITGIVDRNKIVTNVSTCNTEVTCDTTANISETTTYINKASLTTVDRSHSLNSTVCPLHKSPAINTSLVCPLPSLLDNYKKMLSCQHCCQTFKSPSLLIRHLIKHTKDKPYSCTLCGHQFKRKAEVNVHMRKHNNQRDYKCSECGYAFMRSDHLKTHMRTHSGQKPYACEQCNKTFPYLTSLNLHKRSHSDELMEKSLKYTCETCGRSFSKRASFIHHLKMHSGEKPFSCSDCNKCFSSKALLKQHHRVHSGELPFICDICGKKFRHNQNLHVHKRAHSGKRTFVCEVCGATYLYIKNLKQHKKGIHGITSQATLKYGTNHLLKKKSLD